MSIVHPVLPEARVLDLCAGSGALGLEALSRGAATCDFVDSDKESIRVIRANLEQLGGHEGATVLQQDAVGLVQSLHSLAYDVAFADPPYASEVAIALVDRWLAVPFAAVLGIEHASSYALPAPGETRRYGATSLTFYRATDL